MRSSKAVLALALAMALLAGFSSCGTEPEEPVTTAAATAAQTEPATFPETVAVDPAKVVTADEVTYPEALEGLEALKAVYQPLAESITVSRQQSYLDHWYRVSYHLYPKFSDIENARKINEYYAGVIANAEAVDWFNNAEELYNRDWDLFYYDYLVYSVDVLAPFVVVNFCSESYSGGAHGYSGETADVFDTRTGNRVKLSDLVNVGAKAEAINKAVADYLAGEEIEPFDPYDVREAAEQGFRVTKDGLELLFTPYEIAYYAAGNIAVPIGWKTLGMANPLG